MRRVLATIILVFTFVVFLNAARAETRLALIVANKDYLPKVGVLANPHKDAALLSTALAELGFVVEVVRDATRGEILTAVDSFGRRLGAAGSDAVGFFYYSGHGAAKPGSDKNYIIPVNVKDAQKPTLWFDAVPLEDVRELLHEHAPAAASILVFDACRSELQLPIRGAKGFAPVRSWGGMLIAYSTAPNTVASDGDPDARAGPYALALAEELGKARGTSASELFGRVRINVRRRIPVQSPWFQYGLDREIAFGEPTAPEVVRIGPSEEETAEFNRAVRADDVGPMEAFLTRRPGTLYRPAAEAWIKRRRADLRTREEEALRRAQAGAAWAEVKGRRDIEALERFLASYGESAYAEAAALAIETLRKDFRDAQDLLGEMGYLEQVTPGAWDDGSRDAMRRFQTSMAISPADGALGAEGLGLLRAERARRRAAARVERQREQEARRADEERVAKRQVEQQAREAWSSVRESRDIADLEAFANAYGQSAYADAAALAITLLRAEHREAQTLLKAMGYYTGAADGQWDAPSRAALKRFRSAMGLSPEGGVLNAASLKALKLEQERRRDEELSRLEAERQTRQREEERRAQREAEAAERWAALASTRETKRLDRFLEAFGDTSLSEAAREARAKLSAELRDAQIELKRLGLYDFGIDGDWGPGSRQAMRRFQRDAGLEPADGVLTRAGLEALKETPTPKKRAPEPKPETNRAAKPERQPAASAGGERTAPAGLDPGVALRLERWLSRKRPATIAIRLPGFLFRRSCSFQARPLKRADGGLTFRDQFQCGGKEIDMEIVGNVLEGPASARIVADNRLLSANVAGAIGFSGGYLKSRGGDEIAIDIRF